MAFKTTGTKLNYALEQIELTAASVKNKTVNLKADVAVPVNYFVLENYLVDLKKLKEYMQQLAATPGLAQYAKDQRNDQTYDIVSEYNAMKLAIDGAGDWIKNGLNATGDLISYSADWSQVPKTFGTGATAPVIPFLDAIIIAID